MKKIFFLFFFAPLLTFAQQKRDNTIIIHDSLSIKKIKEVLFTAGYDLNKNDSDFISTYPKNLKGCTIKIMFQKRDSIWIVKAMAKDNALQYVLFKDMEMELASVVYGGMKGSSMRDTWNELDGIAKQLSNKIEYAKQ